MVTKTAEKQVSGRKARKVVEAVVEEEVKKIEEAPEKRGRPRKGEEKGGQAPTPTAEEKPKRGKKAAKETGITAEMVDGEKKHHVQVRMSAHTWNLFRAACESHGGTPEDFLRAHIAEVAKGFHDTDPAKAEKAAAKLAK